MEKFQEKPDGRRRRQRERRQTRNLLIPQGYVNSFSRYRVAANRFPFEGIVNKSKIRARLTVFPENPRSGNPIGLLFETLNVAYY